MPPIKIGVVYSYTGSNADAGPIVDAAMNAWLAQHKGVMSGRKVELIKRDDTGVAPDVARRLSTELVVQDHVDFLMGSIYTPNAVAMAAASTQSKTPYCMVNAAGQGLLAKAPYTTRLGVTMAQIADPLAKWAAKNGVKTVYNVLANYQPGIDGGKAFSDTFTAAGGKMIGEVLVPVNNTEFSAYIQRVKDAKPDAVFVFVGAGIPAVGILQSVPPSRTRQDGHPHPRFGRRARRGRVAADGRRTQRRDQLAELFGRARLEDSTAIS